MSNQAKYDIAIIGGGLAGLSLAILSAKEGYSVIVFEKESYPHHKVCGEYISMESHDFLKRLGLRLEELHLPVIKTLQLSSPSGKMITHKLDPGGFGISRYMIDHELAKIASGNGVILKEKTKVTAIRFNETGFILSTPETEYQSTIAVAAYGKRSNLDIKLKRPFISRKANRNNNLVAVKYHVEFNQPIDTISLHNFENGYCGISAVENNTYCLCYLTSSVNLNRYGNSIHEMEKHILQKNPHLTNIFTHAKFKWESPISISQISFDNKSQVEDHVLMTGDAAGMITPLCGNGMSMALHSGNLAFAAINSFLKNEISRNKMEDLYSKEWQKAFSKRMSFGRTMQYLFGKVWLTNIFISFVKPFPFITRWLISKSHGKPF